MTARTNGATMAILARLAGLAALLSIGGCFGSSSLFESVAGTEPHARASPYERAKHHLTAGRTGLAVRDFQAALRGDPGSVIALNGLAAAYDRLGRHDLSARYYARALAIDPDSAQTLNNVGVSYLMQERFDLAAAYLRDAQRRDRRDPVIRNNRRAAEAALVATHRRGRGEQPAARSQKRRDPVQPVRPWLVRTAPGVQTLITRPHGASMALAVRAGVDPRLVPSRTRQGGVGSPLPAPLTAPLATSQRVGRGRTDVPKIVLPGYIAAPIRPARSVVRGASRGSMRPLRDCEDRSIRAVVWPATFSSVRRRCRAPDET